MIDTIYSLTLNNQDLNVTPQLVSRCLAFLLKFNFIQVNE